MRVGNLISEISLASLGSRAQGRAAGLVHRWKSRKIFYKTFYEVFCHSVYLLVFPRYLVSSMTKSVAAVDERLFTSRTEELLSSSKKTKQSARGRSVAMSVSSAEFATPDTTFGGSGVAAQRLDDFEDESLESTHWLQVYLPLLL